MDVYKDLKSKVSNASEMFRACSYEKFLLRSPVNVRAHARFLRITIVMGNTLLTMERAWRSFVNSLSRVHEDFAPLWDPYHSLDFEVVNIDRQLLERQPCARFLLFYEIYLEKYYNNVLNFIRNNVNNNFLLTFILWAII